MYTILNAHTGSSGYITYVAYVLHEQRVCVTLPLAYFFGAPVNRLEQPHSTCKGHTGSTSHVPAATQHLNPGVLPVYSASSAWFFAKIEKYHVDSHIDVTSATFTIVSMQT